MFINNSLKETYFTLDDLRYTVATKTKLKKADWKKKRFRELVSLLEEHKVTPIKKPKSARL